MSFLDVYIGDLSDPSFHWDGGDWNGNVPTRLSPFFPGGDRIRRVMLERIESKAYEGKQTDWGGYVAKVTKQQIKDLIEEQYRDHGWYKDPSPMPHMLQALQELRRFVDALDDRKQHALVATEL
jgi:hypothetical protein